VTVGAKHALFNLAVALFEPGDEVIVPAPYWVSYPEQVRLMGAEPVIVETAEEGAFRMTPEALRRALSPRTKAVVLCTPSNPTGSAYDEAELRAILDVVRAHDVWLIVDEIYSDLVYDGFSHVSCLRLAPDLAHRMVVVDGVSKTYAMTGWRIGWAIAPPPLTKALDVVQGQSTTNPTAIAQYAALAALDGPQEDVERMRATFQARRDCMVRRLNRVPGVRCRVPEGAFYVFPDCRDLLRKLGSTMWNGAAITTDEHLAFWLLEAAHVVTVPGSAFGAPGYLRLSYAHSEARIEAGMDALERLVAGALGA
jgi:aspartate aminotransferase